jgi:hypothetical protein
LELICQPAAFIAFVLAAIHIISGGAIWLGALGFFLGFVLQLLPVAFGKFVVMNADVSAAS